MKKVISLMSLLCFSASIMGVDIFVQVIKDKTNQIKPRTTLVVNVQLNDNMDQLAEKINRAAAGTPGVFEPLKVERLVVRGKNMLTPENKNETVKSGIFLNDAVQGFVILESAIPVWD